MGYSTSIRKMHIEMRRERNPFLVFLKWCSVVGGVILLLYVLIKLQKLEDTFTSNIAVEISRDLEGIDWENENDTGQGRMLLEETTEDTDESSTVDFMDSAGMDPNRPDGP